MKKSNRKKPRALVPVLLALLLALAGCGSQSKGGMYIQPTTLTEQEQAVADLLGADTDQTLYDFVLAEGVQSMQVNAYRLQDGAWQRVVGGSRAFEDQSGRLALGFDRLAEGLRIAVQSEHQSGAERCDTEPEEDLAQMAMSTVRLGERTDLAWDEELPLVLQIVTSQNEIRTGDTGLFFDPAALQAQGHEEVYAITVRFSQKTVAELDIAQKPAA